MRKRRTARRPVAQELSAAETEKMLNKIGKLLKNKRQDRTTLESFSYEINISRSAMTRYEAGGDMYLSTFLKLLHGLDIKPEDFFKDI
ncbi:helix-turn-helix domain-containing protein [Niastella sp. OAS944]|uniref:helix-turn-helix domain-containing protein n=1 Tax=Niastella sp. OAS944 TaxID=2664089 RepID=UPI00346EA618|nr:transcriptional regulator with XRE-family HTH domain [Chitinophagaceae bacterium OAS944]